MEDKSKMSPGFLQEVQKRLELIKKDVTVMHTFYDAGIQGQSMQIPFNVSGEDFTNDEWVILNNIEEIRQMAFATCMGLLVQKK